MNKIPRIFRALIILSALLFVPANVLALSDLDTKFWIQAHRQGQEQQLQCDFLKISSGNLYCTNGGIDDLIPLSNIKQLNVEYMGKLYVVSDINTSDINSINIMSTKKQEAVSAQQNNRQERPRIASTEGVDINTGLPSERTSEMFQQQSSRQKITAVSTKQNKKKSTEEKYEIFDGSGRPWGLPVTTAAPGTWSNGSNLQDSKGVYWKKVNGMWRESDKATYSSGKAYDDSYNKCLDSKIKGEETRDGVNAIKSVCRAKAQKSYDKKMKWNLLLQKVGL